MAMIVSLYLFNYNDMEGDAFYGASVMVIFLDLIIKEY